MRLLYPEEHVNRALFFAICVVLGGICGATAYSWRQATYVPQGYTLASEHVTSTSSSHQGLIDQERFNPNRIQPQDSSLEITLDEADISQILMDSLAQLPQTESLLQAAKGINTSIQTNQIESGVVVNLSDLPPNLLPPELEATLGKFTQMFPMATDRDIFIGIQGHPQVESGRLALGDDAVVSIGRLQLPLKELSAQLGISTHDIESYVADYLTRSGVNLADIELKDGQVVISGSAP